ncbi:MAG: hypothetical protein ACQEXJ_02550 [Myxococcota bacterium]
MTAPRRVLAGACLASLVAATVAPRAHAIDDGFYVRLGLGYAGVSGERGAPMDTRGGCAPIGRPPATAPGPYLWAEEVDEGLPCVYTGSSREAPAQERFGEMVRTGVGAGPAMRLGLGWNIRGFVSLEATTLAHGRAGIDSGQLHAGFLLRYHPVRHAIHHDDRPWDVNVFAGLGYTLATYHPDEEIQGLVSEARADDAKGWDGVHYSVGLGVDHAVHRWISVGMDLAVILPRYLTWIVDFGDGLRSLPEESPRAVVFAPTIHATVHFGPR